MTGPFFVEGAEPGDTLVVRIDRHDAQSATPAGPSRWSRRTSSIRRRRAAARARSASIWDIDRKAGTARLAEPPPGLADWSRAARADDRLLRRRAGARPGDLDRDQRPRRRQHGLPRLRPGRRPSTSRSPRPARSSISATATPARATARSSAPASRPPSRSSSPSASLKGKTIGWPRGENADDIFTVGNARPLDQALQHATTEMLRWLGDGLRARRDRRQPSPRPGRALRHRQRLQPGLFGLVPNRETCAGRAEAAPRLAGSVF